MRFASTSLFVLVILSAVLSFLFSFLSIATSLACADNYVRSCNSIGEVKNTFYTNETVYVCAANVSANVSGVVRVYIVNDSSAWSVNKTLVDASTGYKEMTTNATGDLPPTALWSSPTVGSYDIVADVGRDGAYNVTDDYVDNKTEKGIDILLPPTPSLTVSVGGNSSTGTLQMDLANNSEVQMLQIKAVASLTEGMVVNSISITASGSGNEPTGVHYIKLVDDADGDGAYDAAEATLGYASYFHDDGVVTFTLAANNFIQANGTKYLLFLYKLKSPSGGDTYKFQVVSVGAVGSASGESALVYTLPIDSATISVSGAATTTTTAGTTTTTTLQTTTTVEQTTTSTIAAQPTGSVLDAIINLFNNLPSNVGKFFQSSYVNIIILVVGIVGIILVVAVILTYIRAQKKPVYAYQPGG